MLGRSRVPIRFRRRIGTVGRIDHLQKCTTSLVCTGNKWVFLSLKMYLFTELGPRHYDRCWIRHFSIHPSRTVMDVSCCSFRVAIRLTVLVLARITCAQYGVVRSASVSSLRSLSSSGVCACKSLLGTSATRCGTPRYPIGLSSSATGLAWQLSASPGRYE